ncbi:MAG: hypothetical protein ACP6IS_05555 [Candidatus Asgardarchaeia archaeon]
MFEIIILLELLKWILNIVIFLLIINTISLDIFWDILSLKILLSISTIAIGLTLITANLEIILTVFVFLVIGITMSLFKLIIQISIGG